MKSPLTRHLQAMQDIVNQLNAQTQVNMDALVEAHWHHAQEIDRYAASMGPGPIALNKALRDADLKGSGILRVTRQADGSLYWTHEPTENVTILTKQGETT